MKNFLNILLVFAAAMETNRTLAQSWTTLGGNYLKTDASTDGVVVGNIAASPSPTIGLLVDGTSLNTTTGEVFRTDAPNGGDTWWRLYRGGTEYGTLFNEAANTHFTQNAPEGHQLWQTNGLHRMQLNQTQYSTIGDFTVPTDGFLGVGLNFSFTFVGGPWTRMHLMDRSWQPQVTELYRDWMRNGLTMTSEYDQMYVGQMADDSDYNAPVHAVFQWGAFHDVEVDPTLARFIYAGEHTATPSGENSGFGKEIMQLHPLGFAGIGDWNAASVTASAIVSPTERLDLLDGRLRIRDLPLDPEGDYLDKYLVVDDVNPATGEFGVVKWRHLPAASIACDWTSAPATFRLHTASAAISAAPCPGYFVGNLHATGTITSGSDENLKTNIESLTGATEVLRGLAPKRYLFRREEYPQLNLPDGEHYGFVAQEVQELLPSLVVPVAHSAELDTNGVVASTAVDYLAMNYIELIPLLIAGVNEQNERIAALEQQLAACCANPDRSALQAMGSVTGTLSDEGPYADRKLRIVPNPFSEPPTVYYTLDRGGRMQLIANSADGKQLDILQEATLQAGEYQYAWDTAALAPGMYYVTLLLDGEPMVKKAVKVTR